MRRFIELYFLRVYAHELKRSRTKDARQAFDEAVFQARYLVVLAILSLVVAATLLLMEISPDFSSLYVKEYAAIGLVTFIIGFFVSAKIVRPIGDQYRDCLDEVAKHGSDRDWARSQWQFYLISLPSILLPFVVFELSDWFT